MNNEKVSSSFRDPSGFLFYRDDVLYRQVNHAYCRHYEHLMQSGLYKALTDARLLIPHDDADILPCTGDSFKIIRPQAIPFISYLRVVLQPDERRCPGNACHSEDGP